MNERLIKFYHGLSIITGLGLISLSVYGKNNLRIVILAVLLLGSFYVTNNVLGRFAQNSGYLLAPISFLLMTGWLMLARLNYVWAVKQAIWIMMGLVALILVVIILNKIPKEFILKHQYTWLVLTLCSLIAPLIWGVRLGGATSWLNIAGFSVQPSEIGKITFLLFLASWFRNNKKIDRKRMYIVVLALLSCITLLVLQKDLGTALMFYAIFIIVMYLATGKRSWVILGGVTIVIAGILSYSFFGHVQVRVQNWINPWTEPQQGGYQIIQSLSALAIGGWFGTGLGAGKPYLIPAAHTDFIFSVIGEQLGFVGCSIVLLTYIYFLYLCCERLIRIKTRGKFLLASGITFLILAQAFIILGGTTKLIPMTGITLPFVSYGGSSILSMMTALGVLIGFCKSGKEINPVHGKRIKRIKVMTTLIYGVLALNLFYWQIWRGNSIIEKTLDLVWAVM